MPGVSIQFYGSKWGHVIDRRHLEEGGVYSHNCNKLNKTNMLLTIVSRVFENNSGVSTPSWPSRDAYRSFKSRVFIKNSSSKRKVLRYRRIF